MKKLIISLIIFWFSTYTIALEGSDNVAIHGFLSQGYLVTTENNYFFSETKDGTFQFNEMGLNFRKDLKPNFRLWIQFFAKDMGILGNDEVTIDYAMADYNHRDWLGLRVGKIKKAHGLYNQTRDVDAGRLGIFLPQSVYHEVYRDQMLSVKGLSLYGRLFEELEYQAFYGIPDMRVDSGISYMLNEYLNTTILSYDVDPLAGLSVLWNSPLEGLNLGCTYVEYGWVTDTVEYGLIDTSGSQVIGSIEFIYSSFTFSAEYSRSPNDGEITGLGITQSVEGEYYYATTAYRVNRWFEFGVGYSLLYSDIDEKDLPENYLKDIFLSLRFDINEYWICKLEGHSMDGLFLVTDDDASEDWLMIAAKLTFSF